MTDPFRPDKPNKPRKPHHDQPDDLSYEDIDDTAWTGDEDLEAIDLDSLDEAIEAETDADQPDRATKGLLKAIDTLDDEIAPPAPKPKPPARVPPRKPEPLTAPPAAAPAAPPAPVESKVETPGTETQPAESAPAVKPAADAAPPAAPPVAAPAAALTAPPETAKMEEAAPAAPPESKPPEQKLDQGTGAEPPAAQPAPQAEQAKPAPEKAARPKPERKPRGAKTHAKSAETAASPAVTPAVSAPATSAPAVPAPAPAAAGPGAAVPPGAVPAAPPDLIYRVQLNLPPEASTQVAALRAVGEITDMPQPGILLTAGFRAADPDALKTALAAWVRKFLPMQLETVAVWAEVIGAQRYIAAWTLQPEKDLRAAQRSLIKALAPLITPLPDTPAEFPVRVIIGDPVEAKRYPQLIGQMQRTFEQEVWHVTELLLIQHQAGAAPVIWETAATFD